ncbi:error-prone DNA polymerase [Pelagibacterium halotolerans]|uniref:error-prone DNA polymerase n=1 Tax=Pelagibacterium halotolerans TaxID=531813 RepID=UPI000896865D|nr:error-prone DNA polymerase [Pelagibacterium halotolerans]QJR17228.1 error-prone DNA polymerase [Pelagibacterium halotolerans]SEA88608.1 error-prone DNA polymerase [Pelagibacterium halotolerans]
MSFYAELATATNFSFLRGASHAQDMVLTALLLGHQGIGIADRNSVAGVVRAFGALEDLRKGIKPVERLREGSGPGEYVLVDRHPERDLPFTLEDLQARAKEFKLAVGARLVFTDGTPDIIAYPQDLEGWGKLCRLLTRGNRKAKKGECILTLPDLVFAASGLSLIVMPDEREAGLDRALKELSRVSATLWLGASMGHKSNDLRRLHHLESLARAHGVPLIATNDVLYHCAAQRDLQDILTCIREGVTIETAGTKLEANAERHLKTPGEMVRLFRNFPEAIAETGRLLQTIDFSLDQLRYRYPQEPVPPGYEPQDYLEELTWRRAEARYPQGIPAKVRAQIQSELALIAELQYATYFLTIYDIVRVAQDKRILCQGRGSAANSAVCFVLGITAVDPNEHQLLFARFLSRDRGEPPDIDVDFEHERREEIIQHIYETYGRHRAGIAATVISYRPRSAIREVGKALGLTEDITSRIASTVWGSWSGEGLPQKHIAQAGLDPDNPNILRAIKLATRLLGFPRHLSQHVGGFVLTQNRLDEYVPIANAAMEDRTFIEWDKDDIDRVGMLKVDVLGLGMLTCIRKAFDLIETHHKRKVELADVSAARLDDPEVAGVFKMLQKGDSIGVFQVESRAQINMLPRLKPKEFYDLVIQVAIVRPGPIQGDMVHPYLRRRNGEEEVVYPEPGPPHDKDELRRVLERTKGVPLFQEQAMQIAMVGAEFTDTEANGLRKAMATFRHNGTIGRFETMMVTRMIARGYKPEFAQRCFNQIKGFGDYGFPESHAASFAKLVYVSAWIKKYYPDVFACALLNSQPMGFYAPAQIVRDAREHGVEVRPVDANCSTHDNVLEEAPDPYCALRIGFRQIDGFKKDWSEKLVARREKTYGSIEDLWQRAGVPVRALTLLADADAMGTMGLDRREAAWRIRRLPQDDPLPLFAAAEGRELGDEDDMGLPEMALPEHVIADYQTARLSLKAHPMVFLRDRFAAEGVLSCSGLDKVRDGKMVKVAGIVLVRQRPGKGNAIFMTIEDETGIANGLMWASRFENYRREIMASRLAVIEGQVQKSKEGVIHVIASAVYDRSDLLDGLATSHRANPQLTRADEATHPVPQRLHGHPRNRRVVPKSRDFH